MISDEELVEWLFDDHMAPQRRAEIAAALAADAELRRRLQAWQAPLRQWPAEDPAEPAPLAAQARWRAALTREQRLEPAAASRPTRPWLPLALAAMVLATFAISLERWRASSEDVAGPQHEATAIVSNDSPPAADGALQRGVALHLASTRAQLAEWPEQSQQQADLLAYSLAQNRLHAAAAAAQGDLELARVLRAFERTLQSLSTQRAADPAAAAAVRQRLAFELGAMQTKLAAGASKDTQAL